MESVEPLIVSQMDRDAISWRRLPPASRTYGRRGWCPVSLDGQDVRTMRSKTLAMRT